MLRNIPQKERQLLDITRQQSIKNNIYTFLLQKREDAALSFASAVSDSRLVDNAQSGIYPVSPKKPVIYAMALLVSLVVPIGFISLKEMFTPVIRTKAEIEDLSDFPILGEINFDKSRDPFVIGEDKRSYVAEQIRQIRTSLLFLGITPAKNKILVTSSAQGEGKTFVATNLAISLALTDKKVVLVELDLRRPGLAELFKLRSNFGIADYLQKKSSIDKVIYQTSYNENLYLIPAGEKPANPSELISNGRVEELLNHLQDNYDYVIVETAPVGPVTDAYIISKLCNATLFIIRCNKTLKEDIRLLNQVQKIRGLNKIAFVFNAVKKLGFNQRAYEYGYTKIRSRA
jgi:tyrosine-protein kinase Etk/Wzc